jgi:hypothetical protein
MDAAKNKGSKKEKGNLNEDARTQNSEANSVTKIKLPEQRQADKSHDLKEQKNRLNDQGRANTV